MLCLQTGYKIGNIKFVSMCQHFIKQYYSYQPHIPAFDLGIMQAQILLAVSERPSNTTKNSCSCCRKMLTYHADNVYANKIVIG